MAFRPTPDPEVVPLLRAIRARIEGLGVPTPSPRDGLELYLRNEIPFLQLEVRREHMSLDLWLPVEKLDEARASGIARAHPFLGEEAVKVRFERAEDLSKVARWIEASFDYAPERGKAPPKPPKVQDSPLATPPPPGSRGRNRDHHREPPSEPVSVPGPMPGQVKAPPPAKAAPPVRTPAPKKAVAKAKKKAAKRKAAPAPKKAARKAAAARSTRVKAGPRRKKA